MAVPKPDEATIFNAARQIEDPAARRRYVGQACGEDPTLAGRVEALLRAHDEDPTFLASPSRAMGDYLGALKEPPTLTPAPGSGDGGPPLLRPTLAGYEILGELGRGGMGVVYKARQAGLNRLVALKMILAGSHAGPDDLARFRTEAEAVAALQHPNIVQIYEVGERDGLPYFSLELVEGGSLADRLNGTPWPARAAAELVAALARAMHYAHARGIIHRDLKPANILLAVGSGQWAVGSKETEVRGQRSEGSREPAASLPTAHCPLPTAPKITDFGLAKQIDSAVGRTRTGAIMGTPSYMAPEQAGGASKQMGLACDIYALGAILYELLTGRPPFRAETPFDTILQVLGNEPVSLRRLVPKLPRDLETICLKCLEKLPARRYASAGALADDLQRFLDSEPILARPTPGWERLAKWARRRPAVASLTLLSVVTAAVGFGLVTWQWREAVEARHGEEVQRHQAEAALEDARTSLYFNHIALADREWHAANAGRAEELLDACPADLRAWEWHYLKRLCHSDLLTFHSQVSGPCAIAYSPDGKYLATAGKGTDLLLLDATRGEVVRTFRGHGYKVVAVAFSPDGRRLASGSLEEDEGKGELKVWDVADGRALVTVPGHEAGVSAVAFSRDGARLVAGDGAPLGDKPADVRVFDAATGAVVRTLHGPAVWVTSVAFSPDGHTLVAAGRSLRLPVGGSIKAWEVDTGKELPSFAGHWFGVSGIAFSPDGKFLVSAGVDQTARVCDVASRRAVLTYYGHAGAVSAVAFSPDGRQVASAGSDRVVHLWDAATGQRTRTLLGHTSAVFGLAYAPDGWRLASCAFRDLEARGEVKVWDLTDDQAFRARRAHLGRIFGLALSADGRRLASAGFDSTIRLWDTDTFRELPGLRGHQGANTVAFSPDGALLASRGSDKALAVWDVATGRVVRTLGGPGPVLRAVAFSPDGRRLAADRRDHVFDEGPGEITVWDLATGQKVVTVNGRSVAFSPDGRRLAFGNGNAVTIHDLDSDRDILTLEGHTAEVLAVAFDRDGSRIASGGRDLSVRLWDAATGQALAEMRGHTGPVTSLSFHPSGRRLASASTDSVPGGKGEVILWDPDTGRPALTLPGEVAVAFSGDGARLAAAYTDRNVTNDVRLWDTAQK
jgi:WD40 repeat protein/serine/threonine protein kinase